LDIIELIKAAFFGLVEGITEWLPVSSTGHMLLVKEFVALNTSKDFWDMFLVVIQLGAILAVCVMFFNDLNPFSRKKTDQERRGTWSLWAKIVVACIPAAAIGLPLDDWIEDHLGSPFVIAAALIVYGVIFIVIETMRGRKAERVAAERASAGRTSSKAPRHLSAPAVADQTAPSKAELADVDARVQDISELDWKTAIGIGIFQILSIVPGTSRSGSTIIGGLVLGCSRTVAAEFTFYLAVPVMVGASGLRLVKYFLKGNAFAPQETAVLLVGCAVAFAVSIVVIRFLMGFIKKHDFKPFGWYRIALGIAVIAYFALHA
jgi:undecaprenyl-diphosphatase